MKRSKSRPSRSVPANRKPHQQSQPQVEVPSVPNVPVPGQGAKPAETPVPQVSVGASPTSAAPSETHSETPPNAAGETTQDPSQGGSSAVPTEQSDTEGPKIPHPSASPRPLNESEQAIHDHVVASVLGKIDPLLVKLKEIAQQAEGQASQVETEMLHDMADVEQATASKVRELEAGINMRIEKRIRKINALIGKRGR